MENLGIDVKLMVAQLINFGIFLIVFQKFISKPFMAYLAKKKQEEEEREKFAVTLSEREAKLAEEDKKLAHERKKAMEKAIDEGKKEAVAVREQLIAEARKDAEKILTEGKEQLEAERQELYKGLRKQIAEVSMLVVGKALKEYLTDDAQKKITQHIISHIPEDTKITN